MKSGAFGFSVDFIADDTAIALIISQLYLHFLLGTMKAGCLEDYIRQHNAFLSNNMMAFKWFLFSATV